MRFGTSTLGIVHPKTESEQKLPTTSDASKKPSKFRKNPLVASVCLRLYENRSRTGDIKFKVNDEEISAHKSVLAALSPKYEAQFFGDGEFDDKKSKIIEVKDVSAPAFKEYLQFFYKNEIELTHENIEHVLSLAETSLVNEFVAECVNFLTETLSSESVCQTYHSTLKHGFDDLIEDCERKISLCSTEVFASHGFINSSREVLFNILQFDSLSCRETDVFNACIAWAKNVCMKNGHDAEDKTVLRDVLGDLLYHIRFGAMTIEEFMKCYKSYKELFTEDEREEILYTIGKVIDDSQRKKFNDETRDGPYKKWDEKNVIECNRILRDTSTSQFTFGIWKTTFSTNQSFLFGGFYCGCLDMCSNIAGDKTVSVSVSIVQKHTQSNQDGKILFNKVENLIFSTKDEAFVKLQPICIKPEFVYDIQLEFKEGFSLKCYDFIDCVALKKSNSFGPAVIQFHGPKGIVTRMKLNLCNETDTEEKATNASL